MWGKTVTCNVGIAQYENEIVKCKKKKKKKKKVREPPNVIKKNCHMWQKNCYI